MTLTAWLDGTPAAELALGDEDALRDEVRRIDATLARAAADITALNAVCIERAKVLAEAPSSDDWAGGMRSGEQLALQTFTTAIGHLGNRLARGVMVIDCRHCPGPGNEPRNCDYADEMGKPEDLCSCCDGCRKECGREV